MTLYLDRMREMANEFEQFSIGKRPQMENRNADALAYLSLAIETDTTRFVIVDFQELPSISDSHFFLTLEHASGGERVATSAQGDTENIDNNMDVDSPVIDDSGNHAENVADRRQPYIQYLTTDELPEDEHLASKVKKNSWRYSMIEGHLYRKPVALEPFLRCISAEEGPTEDHEGICGSHSGGRSLAHKILTQGYFWPYWKKDAKEYAQKCVPCQEHAPIPKRPANELHPVFSPWSFSMWGLDIVGPLPKAPGGVKFILDATDYFTKWVEAVALVHVTRHDVKRQWEAVRFWGDQRFLQEPEYSPQLLISLLCSEQRAGGSDQSRYHGQSQEKDGESEGEVDIRIPWSPMVLSDDPKKIHWSFTIYTGLWDRGGHTHRGTSQDYQNSRCQIWKKIDSIVALDKELLEEQRETSLQQLVRYQQAIKMIYDPKVIERSFKLGEYVLKKTRAATMEPNCGKLGTTGKVLT
ncbi:uncharacterized protein LOC113351497 [Papaver somniferum]|uniref:uncharacterized protein LOC113351497 n=1 Tax=Papaver somniferum TaxID=3469 RepID=UPI000E705020|nr:uncharacterized protein LOC113351497 [Papaver somniferum]